jgi:acyl dehydratase
MTDAYTDPVTAADIAVGDTGPEVVVADLEREDFVRYAGASGDFNPIHYDVPYARAAGNPDVFAQGMLTAGFGAHFVSDWFGLSNVTQYSVRFQSQVFPGDTVTVTGEVTAVDQHTDGATVEADIVGETEESRVLSGTVRASVPP